MTIAIVIISVAIISFVGGFIVHDPAVELYEKAKAKLADKLDDVSDKLDG